MGEYIDNGTGKDDDSDYGHNASGVNYRDSDPHNALVDTPLLSDEDEFDIRSHRSSSVCTVAEQGFHRKDDSTGSSSAKRQLMMAIALCFIFMVAEIIGGYMAGSLAIMADAAHLLSDCVSFIVSLVAIWMSNKPPDQRMSFGYKRAEVIGAIMSIFGIWLLTAFLCYFSLSRLIQNDFDIDARTMMIISGIGIIINVIMAFILHGSCSMPHGHSHGHGHGHSHSHSPPTKHYSRLKSSVNETANHHHHHPPGNGGVGGPSDGGGGGSGDVQATFIINGHHLHNAARRSDSVCSYRSPSHSRTNSFSRPNGGGGGGSGSGLVNGPAPGSPSAILPPGSVHHAVLQMRLDDAVSAASAGVCSDSDTKLCAGDRRSSDSDCLPGPPKRVANLNLQAAVIHVIGDFIQSVGVFIAAVVINYYPNAKIVDPLCTVLFSVIVMCTTVRIMRSSFAIIMDAVPADVDLHRLSGELSCLPGVRSVHDLVVFSVTVDWSVMAVHLVVDPGHSAEKILINATEMAREDFGIRHCTIQLERGAEQAYSNGLVHTIQRHSPQSQTPLAQHHHHDHLLDHHHGDAMIHFV